MALQQQGVRSKKVVYFSCCWSQRYSLISVGGGNISKGLLCKVKDELTHAFEALLLSPKGKNMRSWLLHLPAFGRARRTTIRQIGGRQLTLEGIITARTNFLLS